MWLKSHILLRVGFFRLSLYLHSVLYKKGEPRQAWTWPGDQLVVNNWSKSEETLDWLWEDSFKASCEWADTVCGILWEPLNSRKSHLGQFVLQGLMVWQITQGIFSNTWAINIRTGQYVKYSQWTQYFLKSIMNIAVIVFSHLVFGFTPAPLMFLIILHKSVLFLI